MKENLWLNLSTGHIGSGRKNWDGSGGTGAALAHFEVSIICTSTPLLCACMDCLIFGKNFTFVLGYTVRLKVAAKVQAVGRITQATGSKYPLVVKLGTITPQGADVYSYAPDEVLPQPCPASCPPPSATPALRTPRTLRSCA